MQAPILPTNNEEFNATFYLDISAETMRKLIEKMTTVHRDFEHLMQTSYLTEHGGAFSAEMESVFQKYFGSDLAYIFDETDFATKFPGLYEGNWEPTSLADACSDIIVMNEVHYLDGNFFEHLIVPSNIFATYSGTSIEYHTIFVFTLHFFNGGNPK